MKELQKQKDELQQKITANDAKIDTKSIEFDNKIKAIILMLTKNKNS